MIERADPNNTMYKIGTQPERALINRYKWANKFARGVTIDIPVGMGWGASTLSNADSLIGIDISEEAIDRGRELYPEIDFVHGDMLNIPLGDNVADTIVCLEGYEHLDKEDQPVLINELYRVIKYGGTLLMTIPLKRAVNDNPFHKHEPTWEEVMSSIDGKFRVVDASRGGVAWIRLLPIEPLISLVMIVKDEESILEECLKSVAPIVDEFIICDTGSTDSTKEIIKRYGDLIEFPYEGDVVSRRKSLELATLDYVLMMDADETIAQGANKLRGYAEARVDCVSAKVYDSNARGEITNIYDRIRLFKNNGSWEYKGPGTHGAISGNGTIQKDSVVRVNHTHAHKAGTGPKTDRILPYLKEALEEDPGNKRAWFYLARTHKDTRNYIEAIKCYERYLMLTTYEYPDETWQAHYDVALCVYRMNKDPFVDKLIAMNPGRAEGYNLKGLHLYRVKKYAEAIPWFEKAISCGINPNISLFLDPREYYDLPADYLSTCYSKVKRYVDAIKTTEILIANRAYVDERLLRNIGFYKKEVASDASS